jgi:cysteine desulfurase
MLDEMIYLDHAATTPMDPRVQEAMSSYFSQSYGNPSSVHRFGQQAEAAIETSREQMAAVLGCKPHEIIFTSCGSESDNLALRGGAQAARQQRSANHLLVSPVEHPAVLNTARDLAESYGFELELLPVDQFGRVSAEQVQSRLRSDTALVSVMYSNNEVGTINPIRDIAAVCRQAGIPIHTDAVQAASQLPIKVDDLGIDFLSLGAHKFYGPKGIGALYQRQETPLMPAQTGGSQEFGLRAGTQNVPYIVAMATALQITDQERQRHNNHYQELRDQLIEQVPALISGAQVTGHPERRLPNHASFVFENVDGNELLAALDLAGFACSSGSACKTGDPEPSAVLLAMGIPEELALGSLRITVGRQTEQEHIDRFLAELPRIIERVRHDWVAP